MELPKPPEDPELKNIIDKLANFVARNGPEFENMTKQKQQDNPKFGFLFGGEHYNYYQYKVQTEQAIINVQNRKLHEQQLHHQTAQLVGSQPPLQLHLQPQQLVGSQLPSQLGINQLSVSGPEVISSSQVWQSVAPPQLLNTNVPLQQTASILPLQAQSVVQAPGHTSQQQQIVQLQQQIQKQQAQIQSQQQMNEQQIKQSEQNLAAQFQSLMQQQQIQIEETITNNRAEHLKQLSEECGVSLEDLDKTVQPIIESCTKDAILNGKSWIFQNCTTDEHAHLVAQFLVKRILSKEATFELRLHLIYLINDLLHHCQRKNADNLKLQLGDIVVPVFCTAHVGAGEDKKAKLNKLLTLWEQNKYFDQETIEKMKDPDNTLSQYHTDLIKENDAVVVQISTAMQLQYQSLQKQHNDFSSHLQNQLQQLQTQLTQLQTQLAQAQAAVITHSIAPQHSVSTAAIETSVSSIPTESVPFQSGYNQPPPFGPPPPFGRPPPAPNHPPPFDYHVPWPGPSPSTGPGPGFPLPDFSKPPPGFPPPGLPRMPPPDIDLTPSVPYFELPAGLMAPLVKLEDHDYKALDPRDIRLPPPMPPSERLLAAVEAFYSPPFHDRPRDSEGWEKLGLYEFFKAKQKARKMMEQELRSRSESRSPWRSSRSQSRSNSRSSSRSPDRSSPNNQRRRYNSGPKRSRSRSQSGSSSPSDSRSPLPYKRISKSPSPPRKHRSRSADSRSRSGSHSPPTFSTDAFLAAAAAVNTVDKLGEDNKGHMLLRKMGWGGKGLGANEQGIVDPIEAADVRDRQDMFKGVGISLNDPFEQFRKSKSQGFITRMQARDTGTPGKEDKKKKNNSS